MLRENGSQNLSISSSILESDREHNLCTVAIELWEIAKSFELSWKYSRVNEISLVIGVIHLHRYTFFSVSDHSHRDGLN